MRQNANKGENAHECQDGSNQTQKCDIVKILDEQTLFNVFCSKHDDGRKDHVKEHRGLNFYRFFGGLRSADFLTNFMKPAKAIPSKTASEDSWIQLRYGLKVEFT